MVSAFIKVSVDCAANFARFYLKEIEETKALSSANVLTLSSLFAIVPMMSVIYAVLKMIPGLKTSQAQMQQWVFQNLIPSASMQIESYLSKFAEQAAQLTQVGVMMLMVTSVFMLIKIEKAVNQIWRVKAHRKGVKAFVIYWAVLTLGPLLLGVGFGVTSYVVSLKWFVASMGEWSFKKVFFDLLPFFFTSLAFSLIYIVMPTSNVPVKQGLISGVIASVCFEIAKTAFAIFITRFPSYQFIYGAFAFFPIFLIWIYLSWIIVLLGAVLSRCLVVFDAKKKTESPCLIIEVLYQLWLAHQQGIVLKEEQIMGKNGFCSFAAWERLKVHLQEKRMIFLTEEGRVLLIRDLNSLNLREVLVELVDFAEFDCAKKREAVFKWSDSFSNKLQPLSDAFLDLNAISLRAVFDQVKTG